MVEINESFWIHNFPFQKPRQAQIEVINRVLDGMINQGKKFFICEMPTGSGKSGVAVTIAKTLIEHLRTTMEDLPVEEGEEPIVPKAYYLTTQKVLQEQYLRDFGIGSTGMCEIKSASNYSCGFHIAAMSNMDCSAAKKRMKIVKDPIKAQWTSSCLGTACAYNLQKYRWEAASHSVTNYSYLLTAKKHNKSFNDRSILILDEAHNTPEEISRQVEFEISTRFAVNTLGLEVPKNIDNEAKVAKWVSGPYYEACQAIYNKWKSELDASVEKEEEIPEETLRRLNNLESHISKIMNFRDSYDEEQWVCSLEKRSTHESILFRPIDVAAWADAALFGGSKYVLMLSATIINPEILVQQLGIEEGTWDYISMPSSFPKENRPILITPIASMASADIDESLPYIAKAIQEIMNSHPTEKGIIHTASFKVARYLKENIKDKRLLVQEEGNREAILEKHIKSRKASVLVSPSMTEGVDLKDDLSRFQIFAKLPYPNLGDRSLKKKMRKIKGYYDYLTMRSFVQAIGRSVRHEEDTAVTYVLDSCVKLFLKKNRHILPVYVSEALIE